MWQGIKNLYHLFVAIFSNAWFGWPSKKLIVIGVTGTDGKTTTVSLIYHILNKAGYNASMISSIGAKIGGKEYHLPFHVTTPSPWQLQRFLKKAVEIQDARGTDIGAEVAPPWRGPAAHSSKGAPASLALEAANADALLWTPPLASPRHRRGSPHFNFLVLEVTSHALDQHRIWGIDFDIGVITNVTHEHLDYHKTYENYLKTKVKLIKMAKVAVVNREDESYGLINSKLNPSTKLRTGAQNSKLVRYGMSKDNEVNPQVFPFKTRMIGEFNRYNVLAAVGACRALGVGEKDILSGIASFRAPVGREEVVYSNSFKVMVDFAHTPNAIEQILCSIRPQVKGRIIHVFGSAGKRDASKRPLMGVASAKFSDVIVLTAEDPRGESVNDIMKQIASGIKESSKFKVQSSKLFKISDRQGAISTAIKMAKKGDLVIITGKAHEKSMNYGMGEEPWDEFEAVKIALNKIKK